MARLSATAKHEASRISSRRTVISSDLSFAAWEFVFGLTQPLAPSGVESGYRPEKWCLVNANPFSSDYVPG